MMNRLHLQSILCSAESQLFGETYKFLWSICFLHAVVQRLDPAAGLGSA